MFCCSESGNKAVPKEYRAVAERLFMLQGGGEKKPFAENAGDFAKILGIGPDYAKNLETCRNSRDNGAETGKLLVSFQNNMDLLIQKTWVEKSDEGRKDKLQDRIPVFVKSMETEQYREALVEFGAILEELAFLFFGPQSGQEDFTEYTFRIDGQVGLFWWYGSTIGSKRASEWAGSADQNALLAVLLLGICYLTNF